jgi:hypothetical protein
MLGSSPLCEMFRRDALTECVVRVMKAPCFKGRQPTLLLATDNEWGSYSPA